MRKREKREGEERGVEGKRGQGSAGCGDVRYVLVVVVLATASGSNPGSRIW